MKKYVLSVGLFLGATVVAQAEGQLGIKLSPGASFNGVYTTPNNEGFASKGSSLQWKVGAIYDYSFRDNACMSTGVLYSVQQVAVQNKKLEPSVDETHKLGYLQVPLLLKLYTGELALDTRLYFEIGFVPQFKVSAVNKEIQQGQKNPFVDKFCLLGLAGLLGMGVEYTTSFDASFFAGISYQAAFLNSVDKQHEEPSASDLKVYGRLVSLDLGIRF